MKPKSSAYYQRQFRQRLREQGLVKKEVWIRPENAHLLAAIEKKLRNLAPELVMGGSEVTTGVFMANETSHVWTTAALFEALQTVEPFSTGQARVELIEGASPALYITMHEYGDLPIFVTVVGDQIIAESMLWAASDIKDVAALNDAVLRTHKYFPLSTISIDTLGDGADYYHMFGALSSASSLTNVVFEIEVLTSNVIQAAEAYEEFLLPQAAAEG